MYFNESMRKVMQFHANILVYPVLSESDTIFPVYVTRLMLVCWDTISVINLKGTLYNNNINVRNIIC